MAKPDALMQQARRTWSLDEFHGGIDNRDGLFTDNQTRFRELKNLFIDKGRKLRRRPPCLRDQGIDTKTQGLVSIDGQLYVFAKKGDTITHTGAVASLVQTLYFDAPDLTTTWTLLHAEVFDGYAVAYIRHTFPSTEYPSFVALHSWDGLVYAPTWVQDPYLPGSFSPSIADLSQQVYDASFDPVLGQGSTSLWTSSNRGNAHRCRTADSRVWNELTKDTILESGELWCYIVPGGADTIRTFIVPRDASWMNSADGKWAYYVLEYKNGTTWTPMVEVNVSPTSQYTWQSVSLTTRFAGGWNEVGIQVRWGSASSGIIRLRLVAGATSLETNSGPTVSAVAGSGATWKISIGEAKWQHRGGDEQTTAAHETAVLTEGKTYILGVTSDNSGFPELINITDSPFPNGWVREHMKLIKRITSSASVSGTTELNAPWKIYTSQTGTVTVSAGFNTVVGVGTTFLTQLSIGSVIRVAGVERTIDTITDNLNATTTATWPGSSGGAAWDKVSGGYATYASSKTHVYVDATLAAALAVGNTLRINSQNYEVAAISGQDITITQNGVDGDFTGNVNALISPIYKTNQPVIEDYEYAFQSNDASLWYTERIIEAIDNAGAEDALSLNTASHDNTGGKITAISSIRQRMLITYPGSIQLWAIDQATNATAYLDTLSFGTGTQPTPPAVPWYSSIIIPVETGIRAISVIGSNTDNLQDLNIGEPIADSDLGVITAAVFWPWYGQVIVSSLQNDGTTDFFCLDYSRESEITAWSQWDVSAMPAVDTGTMVAAGSKLWFRSGVSLYHFNAAATAFIDYSDVSGDAYESSALFHFNDMGKPGTSKRYIALDVVQDGESNISFQITPYGAYGNGNAGPVFNGPTISGITYGRSRIPMALSGTAISPKITTKSEAGWKLQRLAIDFLTMRR